MKIWPGKPYPLGATYDGAGTNFSLFSESATKVELCLFDDAGKETRFELPEMNALCWHGYLPDVNPGQRYGYRVYGPWEPEKGNRFQPQKLLLDPYAKAVEGAPKWDNALWSYAFDNPDQRNDADSAPFAPRSVVINPFFDWRDDRKPQISWGDTVVYEAHVKGFTKRHPNIPENLRGTYAGLGSPAAIDHLRKLGITAIELMPVHQFVTSRNLQEKGLNNYWGYDTVCFLAPHNAYAAGGQRGQQVQEFKEMVRQLHVAGIEVILDVVYNHTAEGNEKGPVLSFKGVDNRAYYRLVEKDPRYYMDYTGTGNSLNMRHPHALQLLMDSLRYWVNDMHVDGFRFDLASTLARGLHDVEKLSAFFDLIQQDPVVSQVKLIAEPWDVGDGGYQVGNFPPLWTEWNGKFRDSVRDFWRGEGGRLGELANRFTGSSDLYSVTGRRPFASINFLVAHDGFTLRDLVSYNSKHNEANREDNKDGTDDNRSWNCGAEGPTDDPQINALRERQQRNLLTTLLLATGVPMLCGGDELGRTQGGNNNAYCQDNEISWIDWEHLDKGLLAFTQKVRSLRKEHRVFRRRRWFTGRPTQNDDLVDIAWFTPTAEEMSDQHWGEGFAKSMAIFLNGQGILSLDERGEPILDDSFYLMFNAHHEPIDFKLPEAKWGTKWRCEIDTNQPEAGDQEWLAGEIHKIEGRSVVVLRRTEGDSPRRRGNANSGA